MRRRTAVAAAAMVAGCVLLCAQVCAQEGGTPAAALRPTSWFNGGPVDILEPGPIYVVEIWATWCPHCVNAIEEVAGVQDWFADYATVVAVTEESASVIGEFLKQHRELDYLVAVDPDGFKHYRGRDDVPGIPHAFLIVDGVVRWHGHPASGLKHEVYAAAAEIDPTCRLVEAAGLGDMDALRSALALGGDPNREVIVSYGSERGVLGARPMIVFPGNMVSGGEDDLTAFEAAVIYERVEAARLLRGEGGKGDEELMHRAAVLLGEAEAPPSDVRLAGIRRPLTPEEYAPLVGEWIHPPGLQSNKVMARLVMRADGTGELYNHILDEQPTFTYTFEVTAYDEEGDVYSVILHFSKSWKVHYLVSAGGVRREWLSSKLNPREFPESMDFAGDEYFDHAVYYPRGREDEPLDRMVGTWTTKEPTRESRTVYKRDGKGEYYFHSGDPEPSNRFEYDIVWRNPETGVFYMIAFFREFQWFYYTCRLLENGKRLESSTYGQNYAWFPPDPGPGEWFHAVGRKVKD